MSLPSFFCISASFAYFLSSHLIFSGTDFFLRADFRRFPFSTCPTCQSRYFLPIPTLMMLRIAVAMPAAATTAPRTIVTMLSPCFIFHPPSRIFRTDFVTDFLCTDFLCRIPIMRAESFILMIIVYQMLSFYSIRRIFKFPPPSATLPSGVRS